MAKGMTTDVYPRDDCIFETFDLVSRHLLYVEELLVRDASGSVFAA